MAYYHKLLKDDEELVRVVRSYPIAYFWSYSIAMVFILAPFFFMVPLFEFGRVGMSIFWVLLFVGVVLLVKALVTAYFNTLIITDRRVIDWDQRGLFDRVISEAEYDKIQDVSYRIKGALGTTINYGTLQLQTAGAVLTLELTHVRKPQAVQSLITDLKRNFKEEGF